MAAWLVKQECREGVGDTKGLVRPGAIRVAGSLASLEHEPAARVERLRLQQIVALPPHLESEAGHVIAEGLGEVVDNTEERYRPRPRQRWRETHQGPVQAVDAHLGEAACPLVDVDARNADFLGRLQARVCVDCVVAITDDAKAPFPHKGWREHMRVRNHRALRPCRTTAGKAVVARASVDAAVGAVESAVGHRRLLQAVANR